MTGRWVTTWTASPHRTESDTMPPDSFIEKERICYDTTIRQTIRLTLGGDRLRLQISNAFGETALKMSKVCVAFPVEDGNGLLAGSCRVSLARSSLLTFAGMQAVDVPKGADVISDSFELQIAAGAILTISLHVPSGQMGRHMTTHSGSRTQSWMAHGDEVDAPILHNAEGILHWYLISAVEVWRDEPSCCTFALLGDSITDGRESTNNGNDRWPDLLFDRLQANPTSRHIAIANQGVGGNRVLRDGLGPSLLSRIDRDVLSRPAIRYALVFMGLNDIGTSLAVEEEQIVVGNQLIQAYRQIVSKLRSHGIVCFGSTITPFSSDSDEPGSYSNILREKTRQKINHWIRTENAFDAIIDFDLVLRDHNDHRLLQKDYDSGDHLHPNRAGFRAMSDSFPIDLFQTFPAE